MFKDKIKNVLKELKQFKSREEILKECVQTKLDFSYEVYLKQVQGTKYELENRKNYRVLKRISRDT